MQGKDFGSVIFKTGRFDNIDLARTTRILSKRPVLRSTVALLFSFSYFRLIVIAFQNFFIHNRQTYNSNKPQNITCVSFSGCDIDVHSKCQEDLEKQCVEIVSKAF